MLRTAACWVVLLVCVSSASASGIYDACSTDCASHLQREHRGGFGVVLNYATDRMSPAEATAYADQAAKYRMRVIWNLPSASDPATLINATTNHPATWGYYVGDEVPVAELPQVSVLVGLTRALSARPLLYVSRPRRELLDPFRSLVDFAAPDDYPIGGGDPDVCRVAPWAKGAIVLQAFSWSVDFPPLRKPWPSAKQMRRQRDEARRCAGGPLLVLWFAYHAVWEYHPHPYRYWKRVAWAAND